MPELKAAISEGKVHISNARRIVPVLNAQNKELWIEKAARLSQRELEREVVREKPIAQTVQERIRPIADKRSELRAGISEEIEKDIRRVQNILSQKWQKPCSLEQAIEEMTRFYIEKNDPLEKAKRAQLCPRPKPNVEPQTSAAQRPAIPKAVVHQVNLRDQCRCTFVNSHGHRCENRQWLHYHHKRKISQGGTHQVANIFTLCEAHHRQVHGVLPQWLMKKDIPGPTQPDFKL